MWARWMAPRSTARPRPSGSRRHPSLSRVARLLRTASVLAITGATLAPLASPHAIVQPHTASAQGVPALPAVPALQGASAVPAVPGPPRAAATPAPAAPVPVTPEPNAPVPPSTPAVPSHPPGATVPILVKFSAAASPADVDAVIRAIGGERKADIQSLRTVVIDVPIEAGPQLLEAYSRLPAVERAAGAVRFGAAAIAPAPAAAGPPNDPAYPDQWPLTTLACQHAYDSIPIAGSATIAV